MGHESRAALKLRSLFPGSFSGSKGFGGEFSIGPSSADFDATFGFFELLLALAGKRHAFLE